MPVVVGISEDQYCSALVSGVLQVRGGEPLSAGWCCLGGAAAVWTLGARCVCPRASQQAGAGVTLPNVRPCRSMEGWTMLCPALAASGREVRWAGGPGGAGAVLPSRFCPVVRLHGWLVGPGVVPQR